jgi:hypothetical protein
MVQSLLVHNQPLDDLQLRARQEDVEAWRRPAVGACRTGKHAAGGTDGLLPHAIVVPLCRAYSSAESLKSFIGVKPSGLGIKRILGMDHKKAANEKSLISCI